MKKHLLSLIALILGINTLTANPVDMEKAKTIGQRFASEKISNNLKSNDLQLVYTGQADRGEACFYVFNAGTEGFVIVSADDRFRPIVGYSDEGTFATENMSPELCFYLDKIIEARTSRNAVMIDNTAEEWQSVMTTGRLLSRNGGRGVDYICTTKWNQDWPYNMYAPEASGGSGGHCYAGCVATAMSQVMKRWNHPTQGTGSHSYYCQGYGQQSANFGQTTYHWELMPDRLGNASQEQIEAVALFMYHCGVAVDMNFSPSGSGANSWDVPYAIRQYFSYTNQASLKGRDEYSLTNWQNMLKESFDIGWPVYYSGFSNSGGHAFVCDGYDDNDLFHFNWGWGGSSDGWFVIDEIDYAGWAQAVFNYVPTNVYEYMPMQPENLEVNSLGDYDYTAVISWTNPTQNVHLNALNAIDQIVVTRDGEIIYTEDNVAPGANMSFTDHYMPTVVDYSVYAITQGAKGIEATAEKVILGPSCAWHIDMTSSDSEGWNGGYISLVNSAGIELAQLQPQSASTSLTFNMPIGHVDFRWKAPTQAIDNIGFVIKDSENHNIVSFNSASGNLNNGLFYVANNHCGEKSNDNVPENLTAVKDGDNINLSWQPAGRDLPQYYIYRNGLLCAVTEDTHFTDTNMSESLNNYFVTSFKEEGESEPSNLSSVNEDGSCEVPVNMRYEMTTNTRVKLMWDAPQAENLTGYYLYRRVKGQEFRRIKALSSPHHTDNLASQDNQVFEYAVTAYYSNTDCESGFGTTASDPDLHFVSVNKTIIPQQLSFYIHEGHVILQWHEATMAERYCIYRNGELIGHSTTTDFVDYTADASHEYYYTVTGQTAYIESNPTNEVFVDWTTNVGENNAHDVLLYPNPTSGTVFIESDGLQSVEVYNLTGQMVLQSEASNGQATIDMTPLPNGTYFVKTMGDHNQVKKVVKIQ